MPTILQEKLQLDYPVIQAPMAGVQRGALAIAVSNAGGLGSLPCAMLGADEIRNELASIRAATDRAFNVNFFCHEPPQSDIAREHAWRQALSPYYAEYGIDSDDILPGQRRDPFDTDALEILREFKPPVVSFHFGLPAADLVEAVRETGAMVISSATTVDEARWLEAQGVDAIIAQGIEAGGHRGMFRSDELTRQVGTFALLPQIVGAVDLPVIAAGGIADARGVTAALALGAAAVQIGTANFVEPGVHERILDDLSAWLEGHDLDDIGAVVGTLEYPGDSGSGDSEVCR